MTADQTLKRWRAEHIAQHMRRLEHGELRWKQEALFEQYSAAPAFKVFGAHANPRLGGYIVSLTYISIPGHDGLGITGHWMVIDKHAYNTAEKALLKRGVMAWQNFLDYPRPIQIYSQREREGRAYLEVNTYPEKLARLNEAVAQIARKAAVMQ